MGEIHDAAQRGDAAKVADLLEADPMLVAASDEGGLTPLHLAVSEGREEVAALLLADGADLNAKDGTGWTPLHWAAEWDHEEVAKLLVDEGADVNAEDADGRTPLSCAASEQIRTLLRRYGATERGYAEADGGRTETEDRG